MKLRTVRYVLEYTWHPPNRLTWKMAEGDLADIEGSYVFEADGPDRTTATCSQAISLGFWVPSLILRPLEQTALRQSVLEFKTEAERLAGARRARLRSALARHAALRPRAGRRSVPLGARRARAARSSRRAR